MKPISLILLTAGRSDYLQECLESLACQTQKAGRLVLVNDGPPLSRGASELAQVVSPEVTLLKTPQPRSGQWQAFRRGLQALKDHHPFAVIHDDDRLKANYIETLSAFAAAQKSPWICSHNLEVFSKQTESTHLILPREPEPFVLHGQEEVCLRYSQSFIPFPGTCFGISPLAVADRLKEEYREMADVVLLCECAQVAKIFFQPKPIYEYRRHPEQVSERMDHSLEDLLQSYLMEKTRGTLLETRVWRNLEKRRADRYFSWAWQTGRFTGYPFRRDFSWWLAFRPLRNRKALTLTILVREIWSRIRSRGGDSRLIQG